MRPLLFLIIFFTEMSFAGTYWMHLRCTDGVGPRYRYFKPLEVDDQGRGMYRSFYRSGPEGMGDGCMMPLEITVKEKFTVHDYTGSCDGLYFHVTLPIPKMDRIKEIPEDEKLWRVYQASGEDSRDYCKEPATLTLQMLHKKPSRVEFKERQPRFDSSVFSIRSRTW